MIDYDTLLIILSSSNLLVNTVAYFFFVYLSRKSGCWPQPNWEIELDRKMQSEQKEENLPNQNAIKGIQWRMSLENIDVNEEDTMSSFDHSVVDMSSIEVDSSSNESNHGCRDLPKVRLERCSSPYKPELTYTPRVSIVDLTNTPRVSILELTSGPNSNSSGSDKGPSREFGRSSLYVKRSSVITSIGNFGIKRSSVITSSGNTGIKRSSVISTSGNIEISLKSDYSIKKWPSFSWATRKGKTRLMAGIFITSSACGTVFFAFQLPISKTAKALIVIGAIGCSLAPIINLKDYAEDLLFLIDSIPHYLAAGTSFVCCSLSAYKATYDLWSSSWFLNTVMLTMGISMILCTILVIKWTVFEWLLMWILSSWYLIIYLVYTIVYTMM